MNESAAPTPARRFWRLIAVTAIVAALAIGAALWVMRLEGTPLRLHLVMAMSVGIGLTLLIAGALMGLLFYSARSGHDDAVADLDDLDEQ